MHYFLQARHQSENFHSMSAALQLNIDENLKEQWWKCALDFWFPNQALGLSYCLSHSRQEYGVLYWKVPLPDKLESCYESLSAFQFVYDSVCLHSALLNWLRNGLEMVLLLYTSHNSPSHQSRAIFYLADDVSIRVCQPLTAALWVVVLGERIVNQHNNNRVSRAGARTSLGRGKAVHQMAAHPEHAQEQAHRHMVSLYLSRPLLLSFSLILTRTNRKIQRSDKVRQQRRRKKKQNFAKGNVPVSSSSPPSVFHHRYDRPIRFSCQSGNNFGLQTQNTEARWLPPIYATVFINLISIHSAR